MADTGRNTSMADEWPYSPKFQEFATFLGVPAGKDSKGVNWRHDKKTADKIEKIYAWGKFKSGSDDIVDVMYAVKELRRDLGANFRGITLVKHLSGWTDLDTKTLRLKEEGERVEKEKELLQDPEQPSQEEENVERP